MGMNEIAKTPEQIVDYLITDIKDLLAEKEQSSNINDFYAQEELDDLKNQIKMNLPGLSK